MAPARLQIAGGALVRAERMHREIERGEILRVHVLRGIGAEDFLRRVPEDLPYRIAGEGELAVAVVLPDPVLRRGDDVVQLLFETLPGAPYGCLVERPPHGRCEAR